MEELEEKIDKIIYELNKNEYIKKINILNKKIKEDNNLQKLIEEYTKSNKEESKKQIIQNENYLEYKECETEINLLIMYINKRLKEITNRNGCI